MLGDEHVDVHIAHHVDPETADFVGDHVAAVESAHGVELVEEFFFAVDRCGDAVGFDQGGAHVAGEEDFRAAVVELKIAFRM